MTHAHAAPPEPRTLAALLRLAPNRITAARLVLLLALWPLAFSPVRALAGPLLLLASLTDVVDGIVARRTGTATRFGSAFDSVVDHLMMGTTLGLLVLVRPGFIREQIVPLGAWAALAATALAAGWLRHHRVGNLHLYSAKAAGVVCYAFVATLFFFDGYSRVFFAAAIGLAIAATAETLAMQLSGGRVDEHAGSILLRRRPAPAPEL